MYYRPTKNLSQIQDDYIEHELFETEAMREAQARFKAGLKKEGYSSVEGMMEALRGEPELDLTFYSLSLQDDLASVNNEAYDPNASPEDSFEATVYSYYIITALTAINKILGGKPTVMLSKEKM